MSIEKLEDIIEKDKSKLIENLINRRESKELSQNDVAKMTGLTQQDVVKRK